MGWAVIRMERRGVHIGFWWEIQKERDHWEGLDTDGTIILNCILDRIRWYGPDSCSSGQRPVEDSCE
jgi:hypothetical protein